MTRDILPQVLRSLEDVGLVKEEMARTREDMKTMLARTTEVEGALEKAKKELKKVKKDSKSLFQDLETLGIQVADERIKMSVYFDAVR